MEEGREMEGGREGRRLREGERGGDGGREEREGGCADCLTCEVGCISSSIILIHCYSYMQELLQFKALIMAKDVGLFGRTVCSAQDLSPDLLTALVILLEGTTVATLKMLQYSVQYQVFYQSKMEFTIAVS